MQNLTKNKGKFLRSLSQKKVRWEEGVFLVEGKKQVEELIRDFPDLIECVYGIEQSDLEITVDQFCRVSPNDLQRISNHKSPNACLAEVRFPKITPSSKFTIVLEDVQDPGNLGTILRIADWYGIDDIVCSTNTVDCFNPKVVQAAMGSLFRCSVRYLNLEEYLGNEGRTIYATTLGGQNIYQQKLNPEGILLMGNEGNGLSDSLIKSANQKLMIPRIGKAESLNVGVATAICLAAFFGR